MKKLLLSALFLAFGMSMQAQRVQVSPVPQVVTWGEKAFDKASAAYKLTGEADADPYAVATLKEKVNVGSNGIELVIGEKGDAAVAAYEAEIPSKAQGYYLQVTPTKVVIAGADEAGTFYGVQTFLQVANQAEVMQVIIKDYPNTLRRGVIEGFYGNAWSTADRISQYRFYGANKMNEYVYGPKDDPYHRDKWREFYPADKAEVLKQLVQEAKQNHVNFVWAMHPAVSFSWNDADKKSLLAKLEDMYRLGVRGFSLFFDDFQSAENGSAANQARILNYVYDEFVKKHPDIINLSMCPSQYNRGWSSGTYLTELGSKLYPQIDVMWTGNSVVDMINASDVQWITSQIKRKPYIWLNYPVTDYCINRMLMGKTYGNDLNIGSTLAAFLSNPMEYAEASKVSLYSIADFSWNDHAYNAEASWKRAIPYLMPESTEAFWVFCKNNIDLGATTHGLRREGESVDFKNAMNAFRKVMPSGTTALQAINEAAIAKMRIEFDTIVWAAKTLMADTYNPSLTTELTPWYKKMQSVGERGQLLMDMWLDIKNGNTEGFIEKYKAVKAKLEFEDNNRSRNFPGTIKQATPAFGGEVVSPFVASLLQELVTAYKANYTEGWDNFDAVLLETGNYYIKYNGMWLTDENASPTRVGDAPVFKPTKDVVNPMRNEWTISIDPVTGRYKIINAQDNRYINENGRFWSNMTNNPYDGDWHSYNLYRLNGKYAIQNAGRSGNKFWTVNGANIQQGSNGTNSAKISDFIFEIIPVEQAAEHPVIKQGTAYYIMDKDGKVLTYNSAPRGTTPAMQTYDKTKKNNQTFFFTPQSNGRWKITAQSANGAYLNELGVFGTNAFFASWNTYVLTEMGGKWSIQNAEDAGTKFFNLVDNKLVTNLDDRTKSYQFSIVEEKVLGIGTLKANANNATSIYDLQGRKLNHAAHGVNLINGEKVLVK